MSDIPRARHGNSHPPAGAMSVPHLGRWESAWRRGDRQFRESVQNRFVDLAKDRIPVDRFLKGDLKRFVMERLDRFEGCLVVDPDCLSPAGKRMFLDGERDRTLDQFLAEALDTFFASRGAR